MVGHHLQGHQSLRTSAGSVKSMRVNSFRTAFANNQNRVTTGCSSLMRTSRHTRSPKSTAVLPGSHVQAPKLCCTRFHWGFWRRWGGISLSVSLLGKWHRPRNAQRFSFAHFGGHLPSRFKDREIPPHLSKIPNGTSCNRVWGFSTCRAKKRKTKLRIVEVGGSQALVALINLHLPLLPQHVGTSYVEENIVTTLEDTHWLRTKQPSHWHERLVQQLQHHL